MAVTTTAAGKTARTTKADTRRAMGGAKERDEISQHAYEAGQKGEPIPAEAKGDRTYRAAYNQGRRETAKAALTRTAKQSGRQLGGIGGSIYGATGAAADTLKGGGGSVVGVLVAGLLVILLYLLLSRLNLATSVVKGVTGGLTWLISPSVLPF